MLFVEALEVVVSISCVARILPHFAGKFDPFTKAQRDGPVHQVGSSSSCQQMWTGMAVSMVGGVVSESTLNPDTLLRACYYLVVSTACLSTRVLDSIYFHRA